MSQEQGARPAELDPRKFRLMRVGPEGTHRSGGLELLEGEGCLWLDLVAQTDPELELLSRRFGFHPLAIEDTRHLDQRPKVEEYGNYLFLVQHGFGPIGEDLQLAPHELHAFLGPGLLVTVHEQPMPELDAVWARACADGALARRGPDFILYLVSDAIADRHFLVLDALAERIEELEDAILASPDQHQVERLFALKRALVTLRRTISPAREVFGLLAKSGDPRVSERTALYFRDVYDHLVRVTEEIETDRDLLGNAFDAYLSLATARTNDIVKQLTIFSVTFLPLTFLTGFFGQNFTSSIPFDSPWLFYVVLSACVAVPSGMLIWFGRKGWF